MQTESGFVSQSLLTQCMTTKYHDHAAEMAEYERLEVLILERRIQIVLRKQEALIEENNAVTQIRRLKILMNGAEELIKEGSEDPGVINFIRMASHSIVAFGRIKDKCERVLSIAESENQEVSCMLNTLTYLKRIAIEREKTRSRMPPLVCSELMEVDPQPSGPDETEADDLILTHSQCITNLRKRKIASISQTMHESLVESAAKRVCVQ